jgi:hypothetical protein
MNEMNELEAQLRSWTPRRPSAKVSQALFGRDVAAAARPASKAAQDSSLTFSLHWLAPAMAALALMWTIFHQAGPASLNGHSSAGPSIAVILSNQSLGSFLMEASNREPVVPANYHRFDLNGNGPVPNASGVVATSSVSTGTSVRLPDWGPQLQAPKPNSSEHLLTNGTELPPSTRAMPVHSGNQEYSVLSVQYSVASFDPSAAGCAGGSAPAASHAFCATYRAALCRQKVSEPDLYKGVLDQDSGLPLAIELVSFPILPPKTTDLARSPSTRIKPLTERPPSSPGCKPVLLTTLWVNPLPTSSRALC